PTVAICAGGHSAGWLQKLTAIHRPLTNRPVTVKMLRAIVKQALENRAIEPQTRRNHYHQLEHFLWFIKGNGLTRDIFRKYKRYFAERNDIVSHTKNMYLSSARIFLRELNYQGILTADITLNTGGFTRDKRHLREGLNRQELTLISKRLRALRPTSKNNRLKAMLALMLFQGLRPSEVTHLKVKDVDLMNKRAFIQGKQRDDRELIDLHPKTVEVLKAHLSTRHLNYRDNAKKSVNRKNSYLFPGYKNYAGEKNRPMDRVRVGEKVRDFFRELGITKEPRAMRKTFVVFLIKHLRDLRKVQLFSRHRTLEMLQVYDDRIKQKTDLRTYYKAFKDIKF
ncbi:MAG: tyrosine-type recombinase/integrase, partial [Nitrososphaerales archaeon]